MLISTEALWSSKTNARNTLSVIEVRYLLLNRTPLVWKLYQPLSSSLSFLLSLSLSVPKESCCKMISSLSCFHRQLLQCHFLRLQSITDAFPTCQEIQLFPFPGCSLTKLVILLSRATPHFFLKTQSLITCLKSIEKAIRHLYWIPCCLVPYYILNTHWQG